MLLVDPNNSKPTPIRSHGVATRGIDLSTKSVLFQGRFGRIFRALPPAEFGTDEKSNQENLAALAAAMVPKVPDPLKDQMDDEESGIPALYTYFGQFIDHDLTFDPASSLQRQNDPDALIDYRTPAFDLDSIYGRGIDDQPYLYEDNNTFAHGTDLTGDAVGNPITGAKDLTRTTTRKRAIIGDPRNDENVIVSQLQGLMLRFHDRLLKENEGLSFPSVQREVRFHYQWVVINDFLKKIVAEETLYKVLPHLRHNSNVNEHPPKLKFYQPKNEPFMPFEFSAAAYRFGHSMVRPGYRLNDDDATLLPIFAPNNGGLTGFKDFSPTWAIDWSRFIDLDLRTDTGDNGTVNPIAKQRLQLAYRIDTSLVFPLGGLPDRITKDKPPLNSLAARNLIRGWRMRLPSGQAVARAMGVEPMLDEEILIGKALDDAKPEDKPMPITDISVKFKNNCPLWVYILAEAAHQYRLNGHTLKVRVSGGTRKVGTPQLGPVGGRIVAETFAGLLYNDPNSQWRQDPLWKPWVQKEGEFGLREFVAYAIGR